MNPQQTEHTAAENVSDQSLCVKWTVRDITPHTIGQFQSCFYALTRDGKTIVLRSTWHEYIFKQAIAIGRRLAFSTAGKEIAASAFSEPHFRLRAHKSLPRPINAIRPADESIARQIDALSQSESWTYVIDRARKGALGYVKQETPKIINIRFAVLDAAANAAWEHYMEPSSTSEATSLRHVFFLGAVVAHELQHSLRRIICQGNGLMDITPPQVRGVRDDMRNWQDHDGESYTKGEGGEFYEKMLFGGSLALCNAYTQDHHEPGEYERLVVYRRDAGPPCKYFAVSDDDVKAVVNNTPDWQSLLPFKQSEPWVTGVPPNTTFRMDVEDDLAEEEVSTMDLITCAT